MAKFLRLVSQDGFLEFKGERYAEFEVFDIACPNDLQKKLVSIYIINNIVKVPSLNRYLQHGCHAFIFRQFE